MIIGFDWYNTITRHEELLATFSKILKASGHKIYIITAAKSGKNIFEYAESVKKHLDEIGFERDGIFAFSFEESGDIPQMKLEHCKELKVEYFFDDRRDVCWLLSQNGIKACNVHK